MIRPPLPDSFRRSGRDSNVLCIYECGGGAGGRRQRRSARQRSLQACAWPCWLVSSRYHTHIGITALVPDAQRHNLQR